MQFSHHSASHICLIMPRTLLGVEIQAVVGRRLHPCQRILVGAPHNGGLTVGHILQIRSGNYFYGIGSDGGQ